MPLSCVPYMSWQGASHIASSLARSANSAVTFSACNGEKCAAKRSVSIVAEVTITFRSERRSSSCFR